MGLLNCIIDLLKLASAAPALIDLARGRHFRLQTPFVVVPVEDVRTHVPSPLRGTPERIERSIKVEPSIGVTFIVGGSGVGKTREATDLITRLSAVSGARSVYLARGYVDPLVPLPTTENVRRVILFLDDYEFGFAAAASTFFLERQSASVEALLRLKRLHDRVSRVRELHGMVVTINTHRLPLSAETLNSVFPECRVFTVPPVTPAEYRDYAISLGNVLGVQLPTETVESLVAACDGRLDTLATFLQTFPAGSILAHDDARRFYDCRKVAWDLFRNQLSREQRWVYDQVKLLKDFGLCPHLDYLTARPRPAAAGWGNIENVVASIWPVSEGQPLIYDGQFGPPDRCPEATRRAIQMAVSAGAARRRKRYVFQDEMKSFGAYLMALPAQADSIRLMKRLTTWFPRDRLFASQLALSYAKQSKYFRAIFTLYRVFRHPDPRAIYSGKWIEIRSHLLLAQIYQAMKWHQSRDWSTRLKVEYEFKLCAMLADLNAPDVGVDGYEVVASASGEMDAREILRHDLKELGYEAPSGLAVDSRILRAVVHHEYSRYLLLQRHREHDAIRHEEIVAELIPDYGEAMLNCATACYKTGNSARALDFVRRAQHATPRDMNSVIFEYMLSRENWRCYADIGNIREARKWFDRCVELTESPPLSADEKLKAGLITVGDDPAYWARAARLGEVREKHFADLLTYRVRPLGIQFALPSDWKIDAEGVTGDDAIETFWAVFSSQVTWDDDTKCPSDASVNIFYTSRPEDVNRTGETFGVSRLELLNQVLKKNVRWSPKAITRKLGRAVEHRWTFEVEDDWPKVGLLFAYELSTARIELTVMCEKCGRAKFWPLLSSVAEDFSQQGCLIGLE